MWSSRLIGHSVACELSFKDETVASCASAMDADVNGRWKAYMAEFETGPANVQQLVAYASNRGSTRQHTGVVDRSVDLR